MDESDWVDESDESLRLDDGLSNQEVANLLATRLTLELSVEPGDEETREEMERMKTELNYRNR